MKQSKKYFNTFRYSCLLVIVILGLVSLVGSGGGGGGGGGSSKNIVVGDNTKVIDSQTADASLMSLSEDEKTITFAEDNQEVQEIEEGDIIACGVTKSSPKGFLRKVTSKTYQGGDNVTAQIYQSGAIVFETEPAALADAIQSGSFSISEPLLGDDSIISNIADGVTFVDNSKFEREIVGLLSKTINLDLPLRTGLSVKGSLVLALSVDLDLEITNHSLSMLKVVPQLSSTLDAEVNANTELSFTKSILLFNVSSTQVYVFGYFPVVVTYEVPIYLTVSVTNEVSIRAGGVITCDLEAGFIYKNGQNTEYILDVDPTAEWDNPTVYGKTTIKAGPSLGFGIILYGTAGIEPSLNVGLKKVFETKNTCPSFTETRSLYSSAKIVVDFSILDKTLLSKQFNILAERDYLTEEICLSSCDDTDRDGYYVQNGCGTAADCNDNNENIYPGAYEFCDGKDNDCDGSVDEGCCTDADDDGYYAESNCGTAMDCNDNNAEINPGATEKCGDSKDNDCDGEVDEGCDYSEADVRYRLADITLGSVYSFYCTSPTDPDSIETCSRWDAGIRVVNIKAFDRVNLPNVGWTIVYAGTFAKINGMDVILTSDNASCTDADNDGYYVQSNCGMAVDCDDNNAAINPNATEVCGDSIDNDCDGTIDEGCPTYSEAEVRKRLIDITLGGVYGFYCSSPTDPSDIETCARWDAGVRVVNPGDFDRVILPDIGWAIVYAGTTTMINGMDVILTTD